MSEYGWLQLATALFAFLTGCLTLWLNYKTGKTKESVDKVHEKVEAVHTEINGRLSEALGTAISEAHARGKAEGKLEATDELTRGLHETKS